MTHVRLATVADLEAAADTLALAQVDYAWAEWAFPYPDRLDRLRRSFALDLQLGLAWNSLWVTDDVAAVALWVPPADRRPPDDATLVAEVQVAQNGLIDVERMRVSHELTHPFQPLVPNWYLGTVGTRPDRRGEGLASALLRPVLDECDRTGTLAWLETSSDDNVRLYERLGFVEVVRLHTPDEVGLPLIVMERPPLVAEAV
jgi:GNAT superfamily N-acetyltransferase